MSVRIVPLRKGNSADHGFSPGEEMALVSGQESVICCIEGMGYRAWRKRSGDERQIFSSRSGF